MLFRLGDIISRHNIKNLVKMMADAKRVEDIFRMRDGAVCKNMFFAGQCANHLVKFLIQRHIAKINIMYKIQITVRADGFFGHHPAHCGAIAME